MEIVFNPTVPDGLEYEDKIRLLHGYNTSCHDLAKGLHKYFEETTMVFYQARRDGSIGYLQVLVSNATETELEQVKLFIAGFIAARPFLQQ